MSSPPQRSAGDHTYVFSSIRRFGQRRTPSDPQIEDGRGTPSRRSRKKFWLKCSGATAALAVLAGGGLYWERVSAANAANEAKEELASLQNQISRVEEEREKHDRESLTMSTRMQNGDAAQEHFDEVPFDDAKRTLTFLEGIRDNCDVDAYLCSHLDNLPDVPVRDQTDLSPQQLEQEVQFVTDVNNIAGTFISECKRSYRCRFATTTSSTTSTTTTSTTEPPQRTESSSRPSLDCLIDMSSGYVVDSSFEPISPRIGESCELYPWQPIFVTLLGAVQEVDTYSGCLQVLVLNGYVKISGYC